MGFGGMFWRLPHYRRPLAQSAALFTKLFGRPPTQNPDLKKKNRPRFAPHGFPRLGAYNRFPETKICEDALVHGRRLYQNCSLGGRHPPHARATFWAALDLVVFRRKNRPRQKALSWPARNASALQGVCPRRSPSKLERVTARAGRRTWEGKMLKPPPRGGSP